MAFNRSSTVVAGLMTAVAGAVADFNALAIGDGSRWVDEADWATVTPGIVNNITTIHTGLNEATRKVLIS